MSDAFQQELGFLGIESSPAFVRAPEGNGCAERFIRTLKENLLWVRTFDTVEELRQALLVFREVYNTTWLIERHGFQTPAAVRQNQLSLAARAAFSMQSGVSLTAGGTRKGRSLRSWRPLQKRHCDPGNETRVRSLDKRFAAEAHRRGTLIHDEAALSQVQVKKRNPPAASVRPRRGSA